MEKRNEACFKSHLQKGKLKMTNNEKYERNRIRQRAFEERFVDGKLSERTRIIMKEMDVVDDISPRVFPWNLMVNLCDFKKLIEENGSYAILANKRKLAIFLEKWIYSVFGEIPADFDPLTADKGVYSRASYILKKHYIDHEPWHVVGERFNVTGERIREVAMKALRRMRGFTLVKTFNSISQNDVTMLRLNNHIKYNVYGNILPILFTDKRIPLLNLDMKPEYDATTPYSVYNGNFNFYCECLINTEFRHMYFGDKYDDILDDKTRIITASESHVPGDDILDDYGYYEETVYVDKEHNAIRIRINHD